jgi:hypothetical protein
MSLVVQGANIAGVKECDCLLDEIASHKPDAVVLTEAYYWRQDVPGYTTISWSKKNHGAEARDVVVLVRDGVRIKRKRLKKMIRGWWGPFTGRKREPRRYPVVVLVKDGVTWPLLAAHFPPGGASGGIKTRGRNKGAWHESARKAKRWLRRRIQAVLLGDLNENTAGVKKHVAPKRGHVAMASNVDGAVAVGASISIRRLNAPPKMHGWFVATLRAN